MQIYTDILAGVVVGRHHVPFPFLLLKEKLKEPSHSIAGLGSPVLFDHKEAQRMHIRVDVDANTARYFQQGKHVFLGKERDALCLSQQRG